MADTTFVQVFDATDQFIVEFGSLLLIEACISDNKIKQLTPVGMFHDHKKLLFSLNYLNPHSKLNRLQCKRSN